jgi:hypothetical protein
MKKIINGITYNTGTAESIAIYRYTLLKDDKDFESSYINHTYEELCRTRKGKYFLYSKVDVEEVQLPLVDEDIDERYVRTYEDIDPINGNSAFIWLLETGCYQELEKCFPQRTAAYLEDEKCIEMEFLTTIREAKSELKKFSKIQVVEHSKDMKKLFFRVKNFPCNFSFNLNNDSSDYTKLGKFAYDIHYGSLLYDAKRLAECNYGEYIHLEEYDVTLITFPA